MRQNWFLIALCLIFPVGAIWAEDLHAWAERPWLRNLLVVSVLLATTLAVRFDALWRSLKTPGAPLLSCAVSWLLIPLLALPLVGWWAGPIGLGFLVAATAPGTLASAAVFTRKAQGNELVPFMVTLITNPLSCLVIPFWMSMVTDADADAVALDPIPMITRLALLVVSPMVAAQVLRCHRPIAKLADRYREPLAILAQCGILMIVFIGAIQCGLQIAKAGAADGFELTSIWAIVPLVAALHLSGLFAALGLARLFGFSSEDRIGIAFAGSQKTLMVGIQVAFMLGGGLIILPMVAYHVVQLILGAWLARRWAT